MIYIHHLFGYNASPDERLCDIKSKLKAVTGKVFRRTDRYAQLTLFGAYAAKEFIETDTALIVSSGEGNLSVFTRLRDHRHISRQLPRPVDFINLLSNTAGFYLAQYLGLKAKNLFVSHRGFPAQMALMLAENDLQLKKQKKILLGGVDELLEPVDYSRKFLGICDDTPLGEGSNWLIVTTQKDGAKASLETITEELSFEEMRNFLIEQGEDTQVAFGMRTGERRIASLMKSIRCKRFKYEATCGYYETQFFYIVRHFIEKKSGKLVIIDFFETRYRINILRVFG